MKKLLVMILTAALLLSAFSVPAFAAEGEKPVPTSGPWDGYWWMTGGASILFEGSGDDGNRAVLYREGDAEQGELVINNEAVPGATYDRVSNTLTIKDLRLPADSLQIFYMGDDFKLNVEGECALGSINVRNYIGYYSTSLNIVGSGTLTVNEDRSRNNAMYFYGDGEQLMHLDIAESVTVHLYAKEDQSVMRIWSTYCDPADGGAITVGGRRMPEAKYEQNKDIITEKINAAWVDNTDKVYQHGKRVKSNADPDGIYAVKEIQYSSGDIFETRYGVSKYNYYPEFNMYLPDPEFSGDPYDDYIMYTKEEFEAQYTYVLEPQPKVIRYTTDYREANRGYRGVRLIKADDPDGVYVATDGWYTSYSSELDDEFSTYYVYRLHWDEDEQMYVETDGLYMEKVKAEDLEAKGYTVATETVERKASMKCWIKGAPYDSSNGNRLESFWLVNRKDDPDGLYAYEGTYTDRPFRDESGVVICPVVYDEENDEYYLRGYYGGTVGTDLFHVKDEDWNSDDPSFSYKMETVEQRVELQYLSDDYDFDYYSTEAVLLTKDGEPDNSYCDLQVKVDGSMIHYIIPVEWREDKGHYYATGTGYSIDDFNSKEEMEAAGYHEVIEPQPVDYTTTGAIKVSTSMTLSQDDSGNSYFVGYDNTVYRISDSDKFTYGSKEYYIGAAAEDVMKDDVHAVQHEELRDDYMYWIEGEEYHHTGAAGETHLLGDVDGDGTITISDATTIQKYIAEYELPNPDIIMLCGDVDGDGTITISDATTIQKYIAEYELPYPIGEPIH